MSAIQTIADRVRATLLYDEDTGEFKSRINRGPIKAGGNVGCKNKDGYVQIQLDGVIYYGHRLAWLYVHGSWPERQIDHINGIKADNRIKNLRDVTALVNAQNHRSARKDNRTSGFLGVSLHSDGKWQARIKISKNYKSLGLFKTPEEARDAYVSAKRINHEGNTL